MFVRLLFFSIFLHKKMGCFNVCFKEKNSFFCEKIQQIIFFLENNIISVLELPRVLPNCNTISNN
jgi:hypothetical protein